MGAISEAAQASAVYFGHFIQLYMKLHPLYLKLHPLYLKLYPPYLMLHTLYLKLYPTLYEASSTLSEASSTLSEASYTLSEAAQANAVYFGHFIQLSALLPTLLKYCPIGSESLSKVNQQPI